jgi:hypothetical protein
MTAAPVPLRPLLVAERFLSLQGEGPSTGQQAVFLRLSRCNLSCPSCDTPYTWDTSRFDLSAETQRYPSHDIIAWVLAQQPRLLVITGGEPLLQRERNSGEARVRTGRDGRARPLNTAEGRLRASELIQQRPEASLREIAREAGVSPSTARDVRLCIERGDDPLPAGRPRRDGDPVAGADPDRPAGPDLVLILQGLQNDPSLRFSESGRALLRWIFSRAIRADEWTDIADKVPPHCLPIIANLARTCAEEWRQLADQLEERGGQED